MTAASLTTKPVPYPLICLCRKPNTNHLLLVVMVTGCSGYNRTWIEVQNKLL